MLNLLLNWCDLDRKCLFHVLMKHWAIGQLALDGPCDHVMFD